MKKEHRLIDKIKDRLHTAKEYTYTLIDREKALSDNLDIAREFGQKLTDDDITVSILRKGKRVIVLGKEAKPIISQLISKNDFV